MDYFLKEEQKMIKNLARKIAEEKLKPVRAKNDKEVPKTTQHAISLMQQINSNMDYNTAKEMDIEEIRIYIGGRPC